MRFSTAISSSLEGELLKKGDVDGGLNRFGNGRKEAKRNPAEARAT
jgi:hypothetical protein